MLSLSRVKFIYQLPALDLAFGRIGTRQTNVHLMADDLVHLGRQRIHRTYPLAPGFSDREYALGIEWLEAGVE